MLDTINSIVDEEVIELFEASEKEKEEESEKEIWEEFEFIHNQISRIASKHEQLTMEYDPYFNINSYNSPIQLVVTPPPNQLI